MLLTRCLAFIVLLLSAGAGTAQAPHTDALNLDPAVREAYVHFYNLDYDGALARFNKVIAAHPNQPMAYSYALMVTIFRELYHQDLLDTTYYAHDSFLATKRNVEIPPEVRQRIEFLAGKVAMLADDRLKNNPRDADALFARGYSRGLHAAFITLADHSYFAAARQGLAARNDSEAVLKIDPEYADANMAIGIQQFAVASLPRFLRLAVGIAGVGGNRENGLDLLRLSAAKGTITKVESRTTLSLFLRHDGRYAEALAVQHGLAAEFPHDYLFRLEEANLAKDAGDGPLAITTYKTVLEDARRPGYYIDPRLQMAYFGLADTERGQHKLQEAAQYYVESANQPECSDWLRKRAELNAGEMSDLLHDRAGAMVHYAKAAAAGGDQSQAAAAKGYMRQAYAGK